MKEQLKKLLTMQRLLDEEIFAKNKIKKYPLDNMVVALYVELGELMNEFPTEFKHWKASAVDNREKGLEEYVDVLHIMLSLFNYCGLNSTNVVSYNIYNKRPFDDRYKLSDELKKITRGYDNYEGLSCLFRLGNYLGFTWDEVYLAYKRKNRVNHDRQERGY